MANLRERPQPPSSSSRRPRASPYWTVTEDIAFIEALNGGGLGFGEWELISGFVGTRTAEEKQRAAGSVHHNSVLEGESSHRQSGKIKHSTARTEIAPARKIHTADAKAPHMSASQAAVNRKVSKPKRTYARRIKIPKASHEHVSITDDSSTDTSRSVRLSAQSIDIMSSSSSEPKAEPNSSASTGQDEASESPSGGSQKINSPPLEPVVIPKDFVLDLDAVQDYEIEACPILFTGKRHASPAARLSMYRLLRRHFLTLWQEKRPSPVNLDDLQTIKGCSIGVKAEVHALLCALQAINDPEAPELVIDSVKPASAKHETDAETRMLKSLASATTARRRKVRGEEGEWLSQEELQGRTIAHDSPKDLSTPKRSRRVAKRRLEPAAEGEDPFQLVLMSDYAQSAEEAKTGLRAPLRVEVSSAAIIVMDLHAHLHQSEIIGLLGGSITALPSTEASELNEKLVTVSTAYPCKRQHSSGTEVDVDPLSEMAAGEFFEARGQRLVGWYHSHPNFEPNPSVRDLETQAMYQALVGSDDPFVGVIVNPWDAFSHPNSHVECFHVVRNPEGVNGELLPYRLPLAVSASTVASDREYLSKFVEQILGEAQESSDQVDLARRSSRGADALLRSDKLLQSLRHHGMLSESDPGILSTLNAWIRRQLEGTG